MSARALARSFEAGRFRQENGGQEIIRARKYPRNIFLPTMFLPTSFTTGHDRQPAESVAPESSPQIGVDMRSRTQTTTKRVRIVADERTRALARPFEAGRFRQENGGQENIRARKYPRNIFLPTMFLPTSFTTGQDRQPAKSVAPGLSPRIGVDLRSRTQTTTKRVRVVADQRPGLWPGLLRRGDFGRKMVGRKISTQGNTHATSSCQLFSCQLFSCQLSSCQLSSCQLHSQPVKTGHQRGELPCPLRP